MPFTVTGSPIVAWVDAIKAALSADATLVGLVTGIYGGFPRGVKIAYPYLVLGRRTYDGDAGAMQLPGGKALLQIDVWSQANGSFQASNILSRVRFLLLRKNLVVVGFVMVQGSLNCELEEVFDEPDPDMPSQKLYHGVQHWTAFLEEAA